MRNFWIILALVFALSACGDGKQEGQNNGDNTEEGQAPPRDGDWSKTDKVSNAIDRYFIENVYEKKLSKLRLKDEVSGKEHRVQIIRVHRNKLYFTDANEACMPATMAPRRGHADSVLVDFKIAIDPELKQKDSLSLGFFVKETFIRQVGLEARYRWEKNGDYFERIAIR